MQARIRQTCLFAVAAMTFVVVLRARDCCVGIGLGDVMLHPGRLAMSGIRIGIAAVCAVLAVCSTAAAQHLVEVRGADTKYRYTDWNYTFGNGAVLDAFYVGVPGSNELNVGGGFAFKAGPASVTPLIYAVLGKEAGQRGIKVALLVMVEKRGWKLLSFVGDYVPLSDTPDTYQVMDTLDLTRTIGRRLEVGVQSGFFRTGGAWNQQTGPLVKLNDRHGAWALSYRFGSSNEFRLGRVLTF
jgi:hypothetical protein